MYLWIVIIGGIFSFFAAMGIGANDVANAFATSVGSKALTIKQAVFLAAIFETAGAVLMGNHVVDTIRKGIADYRCFEEQGYLLMYGCMWVILSVGIWLFIASYFEMPVSTTHSCVGGMIGMTLVLGGSDCVIWYKQLPTFPYIGGVGGIVLSWFISPLFSGIIAVIIFALIRTLVLRKQFNTKRINWAYPILIGITITINTFLIIYKGAKGIGLDKIQAIGIALGMGLSSALITLPLVPKLKTIVENKFKNNSTNSDTTNLEIEMTELNIRSDVELNRIISLHRNAEKFDPKTEEVFKYLQVFTAICDSFSHGANDVANAIGPYVAIYTIYHSGGDIDKKTDMDSNAYWILGMGGFGIAVGLLMYGYKITNAIGFKLCKITPSRGVAIELSSALIIITGSRLKIPLSTTHCQVGSTVGVGLLEDVKNCGGINKKILIRTAFGWIITCIIVGVLSALLTSQGIYGPSAIGWNNCPINVTNNMTL